MSLGPEPIFDSSLLYYSVIFVLALVTVLGPLLVRSRFELRATRFALLGGLGYGTVYTGVFWLVLFWASPSDEGVTFPGIAWMLENPVAVGETLIVWLVFLGLIVLPGILVLSVQATVSLYLYAWRGIKTPLVVLFVMSLLCGLFFLQVGADSGDLFSFVLYVILVTVPGLGVICAVAMIEEGIAQLRDTRHGDPQ